MVLNTSCIKLLSRCENILPSLFNIYSRCKDIYGLSKYNYCVSSSAVGLFKMKIDTVEFKGILTPELKTLLSVFDKYNYEIRIAGGAVRDLLSGKAPNDVDFATDATPDQMKDMFIKEEIRMINAKGEKHGTITARIGNENFEVTTLRIDVVTDGRHAEVEFTKDWKLDACRRDFTVNSMFLGADGTLYDYCNGYQDLLNRKVVFVGDATKRIVEDYLRILRYFRFYGKICEKADDHDKDTLRVIAENIDGLSRISGERIWVEMKKILTGNYAYNLVGRLIECGAANHIGLPQAATVQPMKLVLEKSKGFQLSPVTIASALFSDTNEFDIFHQRCKLSKRERHLGLFIIEYRECDADLKYFKVLLLTPKQPPVTHEQITELFMYRGDIAKLNDFLAWEPPKLPINGNDLLDCGVPPGRQLGNVMSKLKMHWASSDFATSKQELIQIVPSIAKNLNIKLITKK